MAVKYVEEEEGGVRRGRRKEEKERGKKGGREWEKVRDKRKGRCRVVSK